MYLVTSLPALLCPVTLPCCSEHGAKSSAGTTTDGGGTTGTGATSGVTTAATDTTATTTISTATATATSGTGSTGGTDPVGDGCAAAGFPEVPFQDGATEFVTGEVAPDVPSQRFRDAGNYDTHNGNFAPSLPMIQYAARWFDYEH